MCVNDEIKCDMRKLAQRGRDALAFSAAKVSMGRQAALRSMPLPLCATMMYKKQETKN